MSEDQEDQTSNVQTLVRSSTVSTSLDSIFTPSASHSPLDHTQLCVTNSAASKRFNSESVADLCAASENKPLSCLSKRQRTKSGPEQMDGATETSYTCDRHDVINGVKKACNASSGNGVPIINNPLSERNIRVENDTINALNNSYDSNSSKNLRHSADVSVSSKPCVIVSSPNNNSENSLGDISSSVISTRMDALTTVIPSASQSNTNTLSVASCSTSTITTSLSTAIDSLENSHRSPSSSTLDYVAQLPDGCARQLDIMDEPGCTPPQARNNTPLYTCSGDEDDDNYLDSSDDDDGEDDPGSTANNDEDESCGEDDGSVISTVGSTCSLRSVASEALAAICRNEQGQTTNQDGSLLYCFTPSTRPLPALSPSLFSNVPPVIKFCQHNETTVPLPECVAKLLKWRHTPITPLIIRKTVDNSGYKMTKRTILWSGTWGKHMKSTCFKTIRSYQKVNHFPGTFQIGRKDKLWKNFLRLQAKFGKEEFGFMPKTFILPAEKEALRTAFEKEGVRKKWIVKPPASARGTGIQVVDKWSQLDTSIPMVVQRYISRPYLINNTKFDLRIYVAVTSFHPLRIFLYQDGLVRFASVEYRNESTTLSDRFMHLTNYSVNKSNSSYTHNTEAGQCQGHRWTLCTLWGYLKAQGVDTGALWDRIADMVIKTVLSGEHDIIGRNRKHVRSKYSCYELFGIDVLLDEKLRPWLLEVNISPSLHSACSLDFMVKGPLVAQLLTMAGYHIPDHRSLSQAMQSEVLSELGLSNRCSRLVLDHRIHTRLLTDAEQAKHNKINSMPRSQYLSAAIEHLTPDDVRHLILGEDELQRAGKFTCIFPTAETHQYFGFLDKPRYYNRLWDAWENTYGSCRSEGIERLEKLCTEKYHLIVPPKFKMPKVVGNPPPKPAKKPDTGISVQTQSSSSDLNQHEIVTTTITSASTTTATVSLSTTNNDVEDPSSSSTSSSMFVSESQDSSTSNTAATTPQSEDSGINTSISSKDDEHSQILLQQTPAQSSSPPCSDSSSVPTPTTVPAKRGFSPSSTVKSSTVNLSESNSQLNSSVSPDSNCKRSRLMNSSVMSQGSGRVISTKRRSRAPRLTVVPGRPTEGGGSFFNAGMVAGGRGEGGRLHEDEEAEDDIEFGEWEEGLEAEQSNASAAAKKEGTGEQQCSGDSAESDSGSVNRTCNVSDTQDSTTTVITMQCSKKDNDGVS